MCLIRFETSASNGVHLFFLQLARILSSTISSPSRTWPKQLTRVGVGKTFFIFKLYGLSDIMKKNSDKQQISVKIRVE